MKVPQKRATVGVAVAGLALGLALAGCSKDDEKATTSSSSSSATSSAAESSAESSEESTSAAAAAADYSTLLMKPEAVPPAPTGPFIQDAPQLNPNGVPGAAALYHTEDNSALVGDTVLIADNPEQAGQILQKTIEGLGSAVTGTPAPSTIISPDAQIIAGTSPDGKKAVTVLVFTEQNAIVTLEFDSAEGDLNPVPTDFVETVGVQQQDATKTGLAALPK
ncbi:hypothetical protein BH09ACT8_BH09ACT8_66390 [soil metagenome]